MTAYARSVVEGKILAGPHVIGTCKRHLSDLERDDVYFDEAAADRAIEFFRVVLRLNGGEFEGQPFELLDWQTFIVGSLMGWKSPDGYRRFRMAFIETAKGSGKSPLAAGLGLYMLTADDEPRAEVYAAASKHDQAKVLFRDAVAMVQQSPDLDERLLMSGGIDKHNIAYMDKGSFFRPISSEREGKGQSGPRPHCALLDEIHEHPTNAMVEFMRAGTKGRRQALIFMITNSGSDRESVCYDYHQYAIKVASQQVEDDSFFSYVCALDNGGTISYDVDVSVERMMSECTCPARTTQKDLQKPEGFARAVISAFGKREISKPGKSALSTLIDQSFRAAFAETATRSGLERLTPDIKRVGPSRDRDGLKETAISATLRTLGIERERSKRIPHGKPSVDGDGSTDCSQTKSRKSNKPKKGDAGFVATNSPIRGLTTAIARELSEDSSAITAMRDSACSEITSRLFNEHSNTCGVRQRYKLLDGKLADELPVDDPFQDEACWGKANPSLGITFDHKYLREQVQHARGMPSKQNLVLRLNFCMWTDAESAWMGADQWMACEDELVLSDYAGMECYGGLDMSYTTDLSAFAVVFPTGEDSFDAFVDFWKPKEGLQEAVIKDGARYDLWVERGEMFLTEGKVIKLGPIGQRMAEIADLCDLRSIAYDQYRHRELEDDLLDLGIELPLVEHPQGFRRTKDNPLWMPKSFQDLENAILEGRLRVNRSECLRWNVSSAVVRPDPAGTDNRVFDKRKSLSRIDGVVALAMAIGNALNSEAAPDLSEFLSAPLIA